MQEGRTDLDRFIQFRPDSARIWQDSTKLGMESVISELEVQVAGEAAAIGASEHRLSRPPTQPGPDSSRGAPAENKSGIRPNSARSRTTLGCVSNNIDLGLASFGWVTFGLGLARCGGNYPHFGWLRPCLGWVRRVRIMLVEFYQIWVAFTRFRRCPPG